MKPGRREEEGGNDISLQFSLNILPGDVIISILA